MELAYSEMTYDRALIQKWLKAGNRTCPKTQQVLSHTILTPNHLVRDMITQWCKNHGVRLPGPLHCSDQNPAIELNHSLFLSLLNKLSSTIPYQKEAASSLRSLTKKSHLFGRFLANRMMSKR
ncbi:hypothetical protein L2E82_22728 [Cichorium intybus]|uniref:Uncharacterized protein n=1 Tax=Cichorium intybus TaxID=13427 RepID=A0ACB9DYK3_CICIN|nr:hypothetical protein L2E82_22728 [Cichorium intybus]